GQGRALVVVRIGIRVADDAVHPHVAAAELADQAAPEVLRGHHVDDPGPARAGHRIRGERGRARGGAQRQHRQPGDGDRPGAPPGPPAGPGRGAGAPPPATARRAVPALSSCRPFTSEVLASTPTENDTGNHIHLARRTQTCHPLFFPASPVRPTCYRGTGASRDDHGDMALERPCRHDHEDWGAGAAPATAKGEDGGMADRLKNAGSPYLLQHGDNPVDWWPWSPEAFAAGRERGVPVMLSVGYSACHWCHVMAHESFEDPQTAALLNDNVVSIKVDREERPDVDAVYMTATQAMTGQGGWPMTVFMTPDGKPFYSGTYFPHDRFQRL